MLARDPEEARRVCELNDNMTLEVLKQPRLCGGETRDAFRASMALRMENVVEELAPRSRG